MIRPAALALLVVASGCTPRTAVSPVSPNNSTEPVSVPGVPASAAEATAVLNGTVTYRERAALPEGAVVRVRIEGVSRAGAPATVVAQQEIRPATQVPIPFALAYNPTRVDVTHRYTVRAEIRDEDGRLLWTTTENTPVFTHGAPIDGVEVVLHAVRD
jgi:putative lipoprotein